MRLFDRIVLAAATAGLVAGLAGPAPVAAQDTAEPVKLTVTEPAHSVDSMPFYVAMKNGFFADEGLDVTLYTAEGGGQHIAAVLSGDADAFIGGPEHNAFALVRGRNVKAVLSLSSRANAYLVARTGADIPADAPLHDILAGRTIAVGAQGGTQNSLLRTLLIREGLDPQRDVTLLEVNLEAGRLAAVKSGQADLAIVAEPLITQGVQQGVWGQPILSFPDYFGPFEYTTLNVPQELIDSRPEVVQKLVDALRAALEYTFTHPDEIKAIAAAEFPTMPEADLDAMLDRTLADGLWQRDGRSAPEGWEKVHAIVREAGLLSQDVTYDQIFDPQFMD